MSRRSLESRLRRIERGQIGWKFTTETYTDDDGELWERHVATNPRGVVRYVDAPKACETADEWSAFVARMNARRNAAVPLAAVEHASAQQSQHATPGTAPGGVLSIETNSGGGTLLH